MQAILANTIGTIGVLLCIIAFLMLQMGKLDPRKVTYSLLNLFGALGILFSLIFYWNLPSALIEGAWALISIYGLIRCYATRTKS